MSNSTYNYLFNDYGEILWIWCSVDILHIFLRRTKGIYRLKEVSLFVLSASHVSAIWYFVFNLLEQLNIKLFRRILCC